ncbi:MAG: hypothetical protein A2W80_04440 [Candidatus Riflebacteria bacterium GWC2_50_8]|nr:MAG: hypothetical protein A2W80_04440 [Candidatus Riflebacteria bacterium GWC2_50_8]
MKADCENFILLLQEHSETVLDDAHKEHLASCANCRRLLEIHDRSFARLKQGFTLSASAREAILGKVQKMIAEEKSSKSRSSDFSLAFWLRSWRLQISFAAVLFMLMAGLWYSGKSQPDNTMQISGSATILKNFKKIALENTLIQLETGEKVTILNGRVDLCWQNSEKVSIDGMLDFAVQENNIDAKSGQATLTFLPAAAGYIITTRLMLVKILGTTVVLELSDNQDAISVIKGKVEWSLLDGTEKREVSAGTKMIVTRHPEGLKVTEDICQKEIPESSSNQLLEVGAKKTGNKWTPLEKN